MRVLLDECVDESFRHKLANHDCQTCRFAGFVGLSNGRLLAAAENAGFHVLVTVDRNMRHQQNLSARAISIVILKARTTDMDDLLPLLTALLSTLDNLGPGQIVNVGE